MVDNFLKKFIKYILIFFLFVIIIESISRLIFSEFNYNNIHYKINRNHKVIKGIDHFVKFNDKFRNKRKWKNIPRRGNANDAKKHTSKR